jgi:hypothetical protein
MPLDQLRNEARTLGFRDKATKECRASGIAPRCANRLSDRREVAGKNSGPWKLLDVMQQLRPQAS